jgi:alpha-1,2-mannosyltransferase
MRILALWHYYHSPLTVVFDFQTAEIPRLLNTSGLLPVYPPGTLEEDTPRIDLSPVKEFDLKLCMGKEWHRFPGSYLIPNGISVEFVKSEFDGMLPRHFEEKLTVDDPSHGQGGAIPKFTKRWWLRPQTTYVPTDLNDLNKEDVSHYVCPVFVHIIDHNPWYNVSTPDPHADFSFSHFREGSSR